MAAAVLCSAWAAKAVELDTMCFIRDTAELYQIARSVAPEGITVTGYSAGGTCDSLTMTLTVAELWFPVPVVMVKVSNCTLHVSAVLVIDSLIDVCALPPLASRVSGQAAAAPVFSVLSGQGTATVKWAGDARGVDLALYRVNGTLVGRVSPAAGQNSHTWERGMLPSGRYVCVLRSRGRMAVAGFVW
jgi:poly(3-hydroxybutyrate) depolymerase